VLNVEHDGFLHGEILSPDGNPDAVDSTLERGSFADNTLRFDQVYLDGDATHWSAKLRADGAPTPPSHIPRSWLSPPNVPKRRLFEFEPAGACAGVLIGRWRGACNGQFTARRETRVNGLREATRRSPQLTRTSSNSSNHSHRSQRGREPSPRKSPREAALERDAHSRRLVHVVTEEMRDVLIRRGGDLDDTFRQMDLNGDGACFGAGVLLVAWCHMLAAVIVVSLCSAQSWCRLRRRPAHTS
jgi:hypothetical protein